MPIEPFMYTAEQLFRWLCAKPDFVLLDVRNAKDFANWFVEGPHLCPYLNIPYYHFIEDVPSNIALLPAGEKIRIVCAKEGSAKYVAELLTANGFADVGYLRQGIVGWGNALIPQLVNAATDNYELYQFVRPGKASCSYMLLAGGEALVFDSARNIAVYQEFAEAKKCKITRVFETHRQADYISGSQQLAVETGAAIMASPIDFAGAAFPYLPVQDGDCFTVASSGPTVRALHTPGHTAGSTCYLIDDRFLLSGDTIFLTTTGRPDLGGKWEEWSRQLYLTLSLKLRDLADDIIVLPGHYSGWDEADANLLLAAPLGRLRERVPAFRMANELKFKEYIHENMRPQPGVYTEIRRINGGWLQVEEAAADVMDLGKNECGASNYGKVGVSAESLRQTAG